MSEQKNENLELDEKAPVSSAHDVHEDPEDCLGEVIPDPWDDSEQDDWAGGPNDTVGVSN